MSQSIAVGLASVAPPPAMSGRGVGKGTFPATAKLVGRLRGNGTGPEIGSPAGNASAEAVGAVGQTDSCGRAATCVSLSGDGFGAALSDGLAATSAGLAAAGVASSLAAFDGPPTEAVLMPGVPPVGA